MGRLTIYKDTDVDSTTLSNYFIDEYMMGANGAQLKIYIYLVRMMNAHLATSISDMADKFNLIEKDVIRALKFWENKNLLELEYNSVGSLSGIHLLPIDKQEYLDSSMEEENTINLTPAPMVTFVQPQQSASISRNAIQYKTSTAELFSGRKETPSIEKPSYTAAEINRFSQNEETSQLFFIAEQYIQKTLSSGDMMTLLFIYDKLHFSVDLIDYLLQYCIDKGKKDFRYIEKVALAWAEQNITTIEQAKGLERYDKNIYSVMNLLGKTTSPSPKEREFINRWMNEFGFSMEVIKEACDRTVMSTDTRRFNYCDGILTRWAASGVRSKADIAALDMNFQKSRTQQKSTVNYSTNNKFNQFQQNSYDFDQLERDLLSN